jgi:molybdopterin converting factor subunit 1
VNALLSERAGLVTELTVSNPDVCADLDTPDDLRRWLDGELLGAQTSVKRLAETPAPRPDWHDRESPGARSSVKSRAGTPAPRPDGHDRESPGAHTCGESIVDRESPIEARSPHAANRARRIKLEIRLFAMAKERAGQTMVEVELPLGASVADLRAEIGNRVPALALLLPKTMIAVNEEYADDDQVLAAGSRVALIPPVSGGRPDGPGGRSA